LNLGDAGIPAERALDEVRNALASASAYHLAGSEARLGGATSVAVLADGVDFAPPQPTSSSALISKGVVTRRTAPSNTIGPAVARWSERVAV